ncbi:MAG TPA: cation:proton antiporter [Spirochaetota bacterium]|nr:cation:proton antiporter [Spirochaetota bacterium]HQO22021.1 cation:proton antiporter [Spirochaetota bacterium]HQQ22745.1 cation:proton antiporter [Spirochaetota bacterium]
MDINLNLIFVIIFAGGWIFSKLFSKIKLPAVLGMVVFGIICSIFIKDKSPDILWELSPFLKSFALIVILSRAGLGISKSALKKVGKTAILMSFVPCIIEGSALTFLFHYLFDFSYEVSGLTGFMLAAVSPAVIVPSMLNLKENGRGKKNDVPTIILAGASVDDVFAITIFSVFLGLSRGTSPEIIKTIISVPLSVTAGIVSGIIFGFLLSIFFKKYHSSVRATEKVLIVLVFATTLVRLGDALHFAALLGVMTCGFIILEMHEKIAHELSAKLSKIWIFAEIILFVLIGFSLDVKTAFTAGPKALIAITIGLIFRSIGVFIATAFSSLSLKERVFCMIAYIPKATVQAALGGVALSYGIAGGETILSIAVISILFTAPLGLIGIRSTEKLLLKD